MTDDSSYMYTAVKPLTLHVLQFGLPGAVTQSVALAYRPMQEASRSTLASGTLYHGKSLPLSPIQSAVSVKNGY